MKGCGRCRTRATAVASTTGVATNDQDHERFAAGEHHHVDSDELGCEDDDEEEDDDEKKEEGPGNRTMRCHKGGCLVHD